MKQSFQNSGNRTSVISILGKDIIFGGDSMGGIKVWKWDGSDVKKLNDGMGSHTSMISSILFQGNTIHTFSMDNRHSLWNAEKFNRIKTYDNIHKNGIVRACIIGDKILTCGGDYLLHLHKI